MSSSYQLKFYSFSVFFFYLATISLAQVPQGFYLDDWQPKTRISPEFENTAQTANEATVTIEIDGTTKLSKVSKYVYGNNAVPWAGKMNNQSKLVTDIKNLSPNILRWPGGNLSNEYFWDATEGKGPADIPASLKINTLNAGMNTANWAMSLEDYYDLLIKTNATGQICINYSYARYGTSDNPVAQAAHYAANWVRYDKGRTKIWELGNENMGPWEAGYEIDPTLNKDNQPKIINGKLYGQHCQVFIDSMRNAALEIGSDIKIGVVAMEGYVNYNEVMKNWNSLMFPEIADKVDYLIIHSYYTPYDENSTISTILNSALKTKEHKDYLLNDLKKYGKIESLPVALTEWNIFAVGSKQQVSYINGMHGAMVLGELIKNQYGHANRWDLMNGWGDGNDHGLFARDEPGVEWGTPHAPFYYMYFFQKYFGDELIQSSVKGSSNIITYASTFSSGEYGIVIVNKGTKAETVELKLNDTKIDSYYRYVLTGGTDNGNFSRKAFVNNVGPKGEGGGPNNYASLPAYGTGFTNKMVIEAAPLSVTYLLATADAIPPKTSVKTFSQSTFTIFPNPADKSISIHSPNFKFNKMEIYNLNGKRLMVHQLDEKVTNLQNIELNLQKGIYLVNVFNDQIHKTQKLIVH